MMRWLVVGFASCLAPTEITVAITTDLPCEQIDRTQIFVGPPDRLGPASGETPHVQKGDTQSGFSIFGGCIELHDSMGSDTQCPIVVPTDGKWHHVAISVTATPVNLKWWLDGKV